MRLSSGGSSFNDFFIFSWVFLWNVYYELFYYFVTANTLMKLCTPIDKVSIRLLCPWHLHLSIEKELFVKMNFWIFLLISSSLSILKLKQCVILP